MNNSKIISKEYRYPFILLIVCFALWGLANNMTDVLLATFKKVLSMSDFQTSWIQIAFYGSYFCLALPAALLIKKYTYKHGVVIGLLLFCLGSLLFYPASFSMQYSHFLIALFVLAGGLSILETSANPYILTMGSKQTAVRRLNLAQSFNPLGSIIGVVIGKIFILSKLNPATIKERSLMSSDVLKNIQAEELSAVMTPYVVIALIILFISILIIFSNMPKVGDDDNINLKESLKRIFKNKSYVRGVVAQFFYVGAQIGIWSFTIRYVSSTLNLNEDQSSNYLLASIICFSVFRFLCTSLMSYFSPKKLLSYASMLAIILLFIVIFFDGIVTCYALVLVSACMSLMFPTIYGLALKDMGEDTKIAASGLVMAIIGGAILTALQGYISDQFNISSAFIVPLVSFLVIYRYSKN